MKKLIADSYLRGAKRIADPGDEFECSDAEAAGLVAAGAAHLLERAVEEVEVERAVDEPERITAAEAVKRAKPRRRKAKKVSK